MMNRFLKSLTFLARRSLTRHRSRQRVRTPDFRVRFSWLTPICFAIVGGSSAPDAHAGYMVTDLGTVGGANSTPTGVNSSGVVTGNSDGSVPGTGYAFLWSAPGPMVNLGALGIPATQSNANAINNSGWVVGTNQFRGFSVHSSDTNTRVRLAFRRNVERGVCSQQHRDHRGRLDNGRRHSAPCLRLGFCQRYARSE